MLGSKRTPSQKREREERAHVRDEAIESKHPILAPASDVHWLPQSDSFLRYADAAQVVAAAPTAQLKSPFPVPCDHRGLGSPDASSAGPLSSTRSVIFFFTPTSHAKQEIPSKTRRNNWIALGRPLV